MMGIGKKARVAIIFLLLFLSVAVDFVSGVMSVLAGGVLAVGVVITIWPILKKE